jgi:hypothetical protein
MTRELKSTFMLGLASALLIGLAALPADAVQRPSSNSATMQETHPNPSLIVFNQKLDGKTIDITYAYLPKPGFITVYESKDGMASGKPIGVAEMPAGDHRNVKVNLTRSVKAGTPLWVSLAEGSGKSYDASTDKSVWAMDELPAANRFKTL